MNICVTYLKIKIRSACSSPYGGGFSWSVMASRVFVSVVLYEILKTFRMLRKSCLGKADKHPPLSPSRMPSASPDLFTPEFRYRSEQSPTRTDATLKKQTKEKKKSPQNPGPYLKKKL